MLTKTRIMLKVQVLMNILFLAIVSIYTFSSIVQLFQNWKSNREQLQQLAEIDERIKQLHQTIQNHHQKQGIKQKIRAKQIKLVPPPTTAEYNIMKQTKKTNKPSKYM